ncbi:hypothetical protein ACFFPL_05195 [Paeniglutamicibacter sulfureus]
MNVSIGFIRMLIVTGVAGLGHVLRIVAYTVAVISGLRHAEQHLAGRTQKAAFTIGTLIASASTSADLLGGCIAEPRRRRSDPARSPFRACSQRRGHPHGCTDQLLFLPKKVPAAGAQAP